MENQGKAPNEAKSEGSAGRNRQPILMEVGDSQELLIATGGSDACPQPIDALAQSTRAGVVDDLYGLRDTGENMDLNISFRDK